MGFAMLSVLEDLHRSRWSHCHGIDRRNDHRCGNRQRKLTVELTADPSEESTRQKD